MSLNPRGPHPLQLLCKQHPPHLPSQQRFCSWGCGGIFLPDLLPSWQQER